MDAPRSELTIILQRARDGDRNAFDRILTIVYDELHLLASGKMGRERFDHTLQPTALVHEAYLRLMGDHSPAWENRAHFLGAAAEAMRRVLIDHARARNSEKRGRDKDREPLDQILIQLEERSVDLIDLEEAMTRLEEKDADHERVVALRFYGGMTNAEIAELLGVSERTIERHWRVARLWLLRELGESS